MSRWVPPQPIRWIGVAALLRQHPLGAVVRLPPSYVEHPRDGGMRLALSVPNGQRASYRLDVGGGHDLVVAEYAHGFEAHLETRGGDFERALREAPGSSVVGLVATGALLGLVFGRSKESAIAGAAIGGLAGLAGVGVANAQAAPEVAATAIKMLETMKPAVPSPSRRGGATSAYRRGLQVPRRKR